ncbi:MAG: hypothetical protein JXB00_00225 [Bacteroidales bacterium]|nr:hypothetical protein [Bacteroidales bacterium]
MRNLILIINSLILIVACEKNINLTDIDLYSLKPEMPITDSLDFNSDQIFDFVISYKEFATYDEPSSGGSITGSIRPLNQNQLLYRNNVGHLFLNINDTIRKALNSNADWSGYSADLISIDRDYQNWDRTWTILSENADFFFLAYKLILNNSEEIGWICLEFDTTNGKMSITDGDSSDKNELIIHKKIID